MIDMVIPDGRNMMLSIMGLQVACRMILVISSQLVTQVYCHKHLRMLASVASLPETARLLALQDLEVGDDRGSATLQ
jgi:hypothetical protein